MSRFKFLPLVFLSVFLVGCPKQQGPTAADTLMGPRKQVRRPDYIGDSSAYADSLKPRSISISGANRSNAFDENGKPIASNVYTSVYFKFDNSSINAEERSKLAEAAQKLKADPNARLLIVGHCSWHGTVDYNMALGDRRARSVMSYLEQIGVSSDRVETLSRGSLDALESGNKGSVSETAKDRRGDVVLING